VIVDALDEGRLLSTEKRFESFLEGTGGLLNEDRTTTDRPKLIVPGQLQVRLTCAAPAALLPRRIDGHFALIHRPTVARDGDRLRAPAVAR